MTGTVFIVKIDLIVVDRLEARVAASRRILALAKRREDVGHRLKLFESGDEERRNSGAGVQLQVCLFTCRSRAIVLMPHTKVDFLLACTFCSQEERLRRTLQRELPRITDELRTMLMQVSALLAILQCLPRDMALFDVTFLCSGK